MERRFGTHAVDAGSDASVYRRGNPYFGDTVGWSTLLESQRILLVAEAGAGKTHECKAQARSLFLCGEPAFFLRLETVAASGVKASLLDADARKRFDNWRASSSQVGYFFLDSIDELQLAHGDFREALKRVQEDLEGALGRATILVTSRPVDIDRRAFAEVLPVLQEAVDELRGESFVRIAMQGPSDEDISRPLSYREVTLLPFSDEEIVEFACSQGVPNAEQLLQEIHARHAHEFARRPQDLIELCDSWRGHGEIRSHSQQLESHVDARLRSREDRQESADLTLDKARLGVQRLALAAILSRRLTIRHSDRADAVGSGEEALTPGDLLEDFLPSEIETLLQRPVFADGGYGRVRFHHRSVLEFLAASEVDRLVEAGMLAVSAAKRMIFSLSDAQELLPKPSMRPVAGWLAKMRPVFFDAVLAVEPSTLLLFGDPESLSDEQCAAALRAFVERYGSGQWRGLEVPALQLDRLARKPLDQVIMDAWSDGIENPEVRQILLRLIAAGRYSRCAGLAITTANNRLGNDRERFEALKALVALKDRRINGFIEAVASSKPDWSAHIARWIAQHFYPDNVTEDQLVRLLKAVQRAATTDDFFPSAMASLIERAPVSQSRLERLLPGLLTLTRSLVVADKDKDGLGDKKGRLKVSYILRGLCVRLLGEGSRAPELIEAAVLGFRAAGYSSLDAERKQKLGDLLNKLSSGERRAVFEADHAYVARLEPRRATQGVAARLIFQGPMQYSIEMDGPWMLRELTDTRAEKVRRSLLLSMVAYLIPGDASRDIDRVRSAVNDSTQLLSELDAMLRARSPTPDELRYQAEERRRSERLAIKQARDRDAWSAFWKELDERPVLALAPDQVENTIWNISKVLSKRSRGSDGGRWDREFLERSFNKPATEVLRCRLMAYWRGMTPTLPSEREEKNTYLVIWTIGLMGLYAEAEDVEWAGAISASDAELAIRYALVELNGLPDWLAALAIAHPKTLERMLGAEIEGELQNGGGDSGWHSMLLQSLRNGRREIAQVLEPRLVRWLMGPGKQMIRSTHTPLAEAKIDQVVRVLLAHGTPGSQRWLCELATREATGAGQGAFLFFWLPVAMRLSPTRGAELLLHVLSALPVERNGIAIKVIGALFSDRRVEGRANWCTDLSPHTLLRLNRAIYRHVDPRSDVRHEGAYSPGPRDDAEDGRRHIFNALLHATGSRAYQAKLALSTDPLFAHAKDRIKSLAHERLAEETDTSIWSIDELARLFQGEELAPLTSADMAHLLGDRLDEVQDLIGSCGSTRAALAEGADENFLRRTLANLLDMRSRGAYSVDGQAADIGLHASAETQASVLLKIGDSFVSGKELRDTIESQLVAKYMHARNAHTGCLLVTVSSSAKRWLHPDSGEAMDKHNLQAMLSEAAEIAQQHLTGDARIMVRMLDLAPPRPKKPRNSQTRKRPAAG